jgi:hypothetical protein
MISPLDLQPANGFALLAMLMLTWATCAHAVRRAGRAEPVSGGFLVATLVAPLLFAAWAAAIQLPVAAEAAATHADLPLRQMLLAMAFSRNLATQLYAGIGVAMAAGGLLLGLLFVTVPGERPRLELGFGAVILGVSMVLVAAVGLAAHPSLLLGVRLILYALAAFGTVTALIGAHRRGPGVQLGTLAGVAIPLLVAGIDQAAMASVAISGLRAVVVAAPVDKQPLFSAMVSELELLRQFSGLNLGLATALALLGPIAAWRRERPLAVAHLVALSAGVVIAGIGLGWASHHWFWGMM